MRDRGREREGGGREREGGQGGREREKGERESERETEGKIYTRVNPILPPLWAATTTTTTTNPGTRIAAVLWQQNPMS